MSTMIPTSELTSEHAGTALIPSSHDMQLAAESSQALNTLAQTTGDVMLTITGEGGISGEVRIPATALRFLSAALSEIACGNAVSVLPLNAELTTQQAADILNVSRPYLVGLLEKGEMSFRKVGVQRRVLLQEVMAYKKRSDVDRRAALDALARQAQELKLGYEE